MNELNDALVAEIIKRIVAVSDPQQIILFGSQACGDARHDSDLDILVVKDEVESLAGRGLCGSIVRWLA